MDLASAEAKIRHVFGDTPITEASIGAAPPDILVKLSGKLSLNYIDFCVTRAMPRTSFPRATQIFPASAIAALS